MMAGPDTLLQWARTRAAQRLAALGKKKAKRAGKCSHLLPRLYLGNAVAGGDADFLRARGVTAIANIGGGRRVMGQESQGKFRYLRVSVRDSHDVKMGPYLDQAADFINAELSEDGTVFVHCRSGIHRSPVCAIAFLIKHRRLSLADATELVKLGRPIVNVTRHHLKELETFE